MHEYCLDWKQDSLTWLIDGKTQRTLERKSTWNATSGRFDYPQTPARIMLSLWPAGLPTNEKGTIEWAGGEIDWNSPYMQNGYYYARFSDVSVECYDAPSGIQKKGSKSYQYTDKAGTNNTVAITDKVVVLGSLRGTGENPGEAAKSGDPKATESVAMVPGGLPGGNRAEETAAAAAGTSGNSPQATGSGSNSNSNSQGFNQGPNGNGAGSLQPGLGRVAGGALAIAITVFGLIAL